MIWVQYQSYTRSSIFWLSSFGFSWVYLRNKDHPNPKYIPYQCPEMMVEVDVHVGISWNFYILWNGTPHDLKSLVATMAPWNPRWLHLQCWRSEPRPWRLATGNICNRQLGSFFEVKMNKYLHQFGCFLKWWYPQIIHFNRIIHYFHHPFWGTPYFWKHPGLVNLGKIHQKWTFSYTANGWNLVKSFSTKQYQ